MLMGASKLMMGLTLVLVICLAVVLALVLVLLAELYCSVTIRRRHTTTTTTATPTATINSNNNNTPSPPLTNFYTQSVLSAPRNILYPDLGADIEKQQPVNQENGNSGRKDEGLMYISNPMFDDENGRRKSAAVDAGNTPFETPDSSPSRLETGSSEDGDDGEVGEEVMSRVKMVVETPPLTPMKKLPEIVKGGGDLLVNMNMNMNSSSSTNENEVSSTSSSGTPCTSSLSW